MTAAMGLMSPITTPLALPEPPEGVELRPAWSLQHPWAWPLVQAPRQPSSFVLTDGVPAAQMVPITITCLTNVRQWPFVVSVLTPPASPSLAPVWLVDRLREALTPTDPRRMHPSQGWLRLAYMASCLELFHDFKNGILLAPTEPVRANDPGFVERLLRTLREDAVLLEMADLACLLDDTLGYLTQPFTKAEAIWVALRSRWLEQEGVARTARSRIRETEPPDRPPLSL